MSLQRNYPEMLCEMPDFESSAQSYSILGPKVPHFVPGGVTQLMVPSLHPSTLVPATKVGIIMLHRVPGDSRPLTYCA